MKKPNVLDRLDVLVDRGALRPIDRHFARWAAAFDANGVKEAVALGAALVSLRVSQGDVCADLRLEEGKPLFEETRAGDANMPGPNAELWMDNLARSDAVQVVTAPSPFFAHRPSDNAEEESSAQTASPHSSVPAILSRPLVLDGTRLYLTRYWFYECDLAHLLLERARGWTEIAPETVRAALDRLFPPPAAEETVDWQRVAAAVAAMKRLCIISGGPGTGKTHTVTAILGVLHHLRPDRPPRTALAAPTGKAAARITESLRKTLASFPESAAWREHVPKEATTLHRLLGIRQGRSVPRHGPENPLPLDVLVIDEASMIDLTLMAQTLAALPPNARLILLGDKDQLASVEAGNVFSDLCGPRPDTPGTSTLSQPTRSPQWVERVRAATGMDLPEAKTQPGGAAASPLSECTVFLEKSYRFRAESGIGRLAALIRSGGPVIPFLCAGSWKEEPPGAVSSDAEVTFRPLAERDLPRVLETIVRRRFLPVVEANTVEEAYERLDAFRILCAVRETPFGVIAINALVEDALARMGAIPRGTRHYKGRPVLVTQNDYDVQLFNGDVGILWPDPADGRLKAWFRRVDGSFRTLRVLRLPPHETAYAMTVHKAQGSEFARVLLVLPEQDAKVLTRELLYTAVTRAKDGVDIRASESILETAVRRRTERRSGLCSRLWPCSSL
uniref:Exodeoxyribonuclease V subunit alpha n=1 Tax=Desulfacinum infernum TaxID=35837 RepID=A0A832E910_9BACT